jgi:hypothetical protein
MRASTVSVVSWPAGMAVRPGSAVFHGQGGSRDASSHFYRPWLLIGLRGTCPDGVMNLRRTRRRALRETERHLAESDPCLDELFSLFTESARGAKISGPEKIRAMRLRLPVRPGPRPDRHQAGEDGSVQPWPGF